MFKKWLIEQPIQKMLMSAVPLILLLAIGLFSLSRYIDPAPPNHFSISTGDDEGDYQNYAKQYRDILQQQGITLEIKPSAGPLENLARLENDAEKVDAAFVPDGLGSPTDQPDVVSLGSLYYEPIWVFYRGNFELKRLTELEGHTVAMGREARGTRLIAERLMRESGVDFKKVHMIPIGSTQAATALRKGEVEAAFIMAAPDDPLVESLASDPQIKLMDLDQAEAISRLDPSFHHLVLPHGGINLKTNTPAREVNLVSPTATLLVRDDLHPALAYLLLKAVAQVHSGPGIFEHRGEFPTNKDDQFPLSDDAQQFYKSGGPFWQRYLPFWIAAWIDRFILIVIPLLAIVLPLIRTLPKIYHWRIRSRIYKCYGELKFLETQMGPQPSPSQREDFFRQLKTIEDRVNKMRVPLEFTEHLYSLRGHIHFVRSQIEASGPAALSV